MLATSACSFSASDDRGKDQPLQPPRQGASTAAHTQKLTFTFTYTHMPHIEAMIVSRESTAGKRHIESIIISRESTAGRMTRTCEDAAGKNAQKQIRAWQPVITSVQRITPDSDGTRQKNAGRRISRA